MTVDQRKDTDDVCGAARAAHEGSEAGAGGSLDLAHPAGGPEPGPEATVPAPPQVADLAAACVRFVAARYRVTLDFFPETLSLVDQWLRDAREEVRLQPETAEIVQAAAGAYVGEVIRRAFGAYWLSEGDHADWRLRLSTVYCAFNPIGMTREALLLEVAEGWHAELDLDPGEREAVERRLASLPSVEDDEYYAPSTRFDVLCILVDILHASLRAQGLGDVRFTPEDYP